MWVRPLFVSINSNIDQCVIKTLIYDVSCNQSACRISCHMVSSLQWALMVWPTHSLPPLSCTVQWLQQLWAAGQVSMLQHVLCSRAQRSAARAAWPPGGNRAAATQVDKPDVNSSYWWWGFLSFIKRLGVYILLIPLQDKREIFTWVRHNGIAKINKQKIKCTRKRLLVHWVLSSSVSSQGWPWHTLTPACLPTRPVLLWSVNGSTCWTWFLPALSPKQPIHGNNAAPTATVAIIP